MIGIAIGIGTDTSIIAAFVYCIVPPAAVPPIGPRPVLVAAYQQKGVPRVIVPALIGTTVNDLIGAQVIKRVDVEALIVDPAAITFLDQKFFTLALLPPPPLIAGDPPLFPAIRVSCRVPPAAVISAAVRGIPEPGAFLKTIFVEAVIILVNSDRSGTDC